MGLTSVDYCLELEIGEFALGDYIGRHDEVVCDIGGFHQAESGVFHDGIWVVSSILQFLWVVGSVGDFLLIFEVVFLIGFLFFLFFFCG